MEKDKEVQDKRLVFSVSRILGYPFMLFLPRVSRPLPCNYDPRGKQHQQALDKPLKVWK